MATSLLHSYLRDLHTTRTTGAAVKETSYYGVLANLLNGVGASLKPKVRCILHPQNRGAGIPDGGLFAQEQWQKADEVALLAGQIPARGGVEVKGTGDEVAKVAVSPQVAKYFTRYRQVLVTNYRDFALVIADTDDRPTVAQTYRLAEGEAAFWQAAAHPGEFAAHQEERFTDYLKRVMLRPAPLTSPEIVNSITRKSASMG